MSAANSGDGRDDLLGRRLGHFRIVERIGRGGMGVVYRAEDEKLRRFVALKVLAPELVGDEERRQRFLREARSAAAVNHPHIAAIYEIGDEDGVVFIAMELVAGSSLRELLSAGGPIPVDRAALIARDVARALARAHEAGVIHRDLKPDNVMIGPDDEVKLLDFGLAKLLAAGGETTSEDELAVQDTISHVSTRDGRILGTPAYMSPEQGLGGKVDHRADIFSFGIMLYEMLAGRRPFGGTTPMATIVALSRDEPARLSTVTPTVPLELDRIVHKCLQKDPGARYQAARELVDELRRVARDAGLGSSDTLTTSMRPAVEASASSHVVLAAAALLLLGVGLWVVAATFSSPPDIEEPVADAGPAEAVSDDPPEAPPPVLEERRLTAIPAENRVLAAVVSGERLIYQDQGGIWSRALDGGEAQLIPLPEGIEVELNDVFPGGDRLLLGPAELLGPLFVLTLETGALQELRGNTLAGRVSPEGDRVAFVDRRGIHVIDLDGSRERLLSSKAPGDGIGSLSWSPDGDRLAFVRTRASEDGAVAAIETVSLDGAHLERVLVSRRLRQPATAMAWPDPDRLVYVLTSPAGEEPRAELWELPLAGGAAGSRPARRIHRFGSSRVSSIRVAGDALSLLEIAVQSDVYLADIGPRGRLRGQPRRLTLDDRDDRPSGWSDGGVLFVSDRAGSWDVYRQRPEEHAATLLAGGPAWDTWPRPGPEGTVLFFQLDVDDEGAAAACRLMRTTTGEEATTVLTLPVETEVSARGRPPPRAADYRCAGDESPVCVLVRSVGGALRFATFTMNGRVESPFHTMERPQSRYEWDLSPAGGTVALVRMDNVVTLIPVAGGAPSELQLNADGKLAYVSWAHDGQALYFSALDWDLNRYALVHSDLRGRSTVLRASEHAWMGQPAASPDGTALAYAHQEYDADVFLLAEGP